MSKISNKSWLLSWIARHHYPQAVFGRALKRVIGSETKEGDVHDLFIIDAPCGNGETAYHLSGLGCTVTAYDIDPDSIHVAGNLFGSSNIDFEQSDIRSLPLGNSTVDYFCLINALFLLPEPLLVLENIKLKLKPQGRLLLIMPNTQGHNFRWFERHHPGTNKLIIEPEDYATWFQKHGWCVHRVIPVARAANLGRPCLKYFSVFSHFYLCILDTLLRMTRASRPNYYLAVLSPDKSET